MFCAFVGGTAAWWKRRSKPSWATEGSLRQWWHKWPVSGHTLKPRGCVLAASLHISYYLLFHVKYKTTSWEGPAVFLQVMWDTGDLKRTELLREENISPSDIPLLSLVNSSKGWLQIVLGLAAKHCCNSKSCCFAGISQSRISHWLLQHGSDLSEQKKRAFYRWYTLEKTTPGTSFFTFIVLTKYTLCVSIRFISLAFLSLRCLKTKSVNWKESKKESHTCCADRGPNMKWPIKATVVMEWT